MDAKDLEALRAALDEPETKEKAVFILHPDTIEHFGGMDQVQEEADIVARMAGFSGAKIVASSSILPTHVVKTTEEHLPK